MPSSRIQSVLFDLDGTFADTAPDLAYALNQVLASYGMPPRPFAEIRPQVSHGGKALIRLGFGLDPADAGFQVRYQALLSNYLHNIHRRTRPFPGMQDLLETLERRQIAWGIVTNKPAWLTDPLMEQMGMHIRAGCVVSGDTTAYAKPHPAPLLHACSILSTPPAACLYIGDAQRDVAAGHNAGITTLVARFGYIGADDRPDDWGADGAVEHPMEILEWLGGAQ